MVRSVPDVHFNRCIQGEVNKNYWESDNCCSNINVDVIDQGNGTFTVTRNPEGGDHPSPPEAASPNDLAEIANAISNSAIEANLTIPGDEKLRFLAHSIFDKFVEELTLDEANRCHIEARKAWGLPT